MTAVVLIAWTVVFLALVTDTRTVREAAVIAFTAVAVLSVLAVEVLSVFRAVTPIAMSALWLVAVISAIAVVRARIVRGVRRLRVSILRPAGADWPAVGVLALFLLGTLASALLYPTTNYDSLTYHMPRVFFWFQNHTVDFYPTPEGRQLFSSTLVEYIALVLKTLSFGGSRLVNLVQWSSYAVAILAASLIARELGSGRRGQQIAAIAVATMPMALLQASTTQTDLTCGAWTLVVAYCVIRYVTHPVETARSRAGWAAWTGAAFALAALAKAPAYLYCAPFLVWLAVGTLRREGIRRSATFAALLLGTFVLLGAGTFARNAIALHGDVLAVSAPTNSQTLIHDRRPSSLLTNALTNTATLLGTPSTRVNDLIVKDVEAAVGAVGGDVANAANVNPDWGTFTLSRYVTNHDFAPAPLFVALVIASVFTVAALLAKSSNGGKATVAVYLVCAGVAGLISSSLLTWDPWINRVLLGAALLWTPLVGLAASLVLDHRRRVLVSGLALVLIGSLGWGAMALLFNTTNPLLPVSLLPGHTTSIEHGYWDTSYRELAFAATSPELDDAFKTVARVATAKNINALGLDVRVKDFPVYPLLTLLEGHRVFYVGNTLLPDRVRANPGVPDAVVTIMTSQEYASRHLKPRPEALVPAVVASDTVIIMDRAPLGDAK